jgi:hypothetical protein
VHYSPKFARRSTFFTQASDLWNTMLIDSLTSPFVIAIVHYGVSSSEMALSAIKHVIVSVSASDQLS